MENCAEVLFEEVAGAHGSCGLITLNRPKVLNSLNLNMVQAMYKQLNRWAEDQNIKAVLIKAVPGRAFCAGGDLRQLYQQFHEKKNHLTDFFSHEYQLNRLIYHFPKPYIALLDGITMGGGVGISIHGSHRVATENLIFAMPETTIGFFPDIGGSYFLPRLAGKLGYYLGLTGNKIDADTCVAINIAQYKISSTSIPDLITSITSTEFKEDPFKIISNVIDEFKMPISKPLLLQKQHLIDACFNQRSIEDILDALSFCQDPLCSEAISTIKTKSPLSLKVTFRALQNGAELNFDACMQQEFRLTNRFLQSHDFYEGIRALIIEKDQAPKWNPASLNEVTEEAVLAFFEPLSQELVA